VSYASAVRAIAAAATCDTSVQPGRTTLPQVEGQRLESGRWPRRGCGVLQETGARDSKSISSRTPGPSRALSQSRGWCLAVRGGQTRRRIRVGSSRRADSFQEEPLAATCHYQSSLAASSPIARTKRVDHLAAELACARQAALHDGKLSYEHRKEARWLTMSKSRTAGSTRARTRR
jgi:hypothetical protein